MQHVDQLIHARWVIPVEPHGVVLDHHSVAITEGRIMALLPTELALESIQAINTIDCRSHLLIPGLINCHTHAAMSLFRGLADDLPLMTWLEQHIWPAEARFADRQFVREGTRLAAYEMLRGGTTCFNDMYFFPDEAAAAATELGIRAMIGLIVIGFPTAWAQDAREYLRLGQQVHDRYRGHPLIHTAFAPHAPYTVDDSTLSQIAMLAEELDVPIHMHVHETRQEIEDSIARYGQRPLARLQGLGLLSPRLLAVHMTQLTSAEIETVALAGVSIAHCPESNLKLASGLCPVAKLLAAGINCTLGTDGAASNNDLDQLAEMRCAALLAKAVAGDPCAVPAATALRMATLNGARALGLETELGSIVVGKQADLVALDFSDPRLHPIYDPLSQLVYAAQRDAVSDVWVAGRRVVQRGVVLGIDPSQLVVDANRWRDLIRATYPTDSR
ncbi:MAG: TRZ/ATZ family hydrolase [Gammaproteobacteria bacterium]|nr:TRZ/ATZ family hydrolase [Gammaproteobacteria bacterium]